MEVRTSFCAALLLLMLQLVVAFKLRSKKTCILHSLLTRKYIPVSIATICNRVIDSTVVVPLLKCLASYPGSHWHMELDPGYKTMEC